MKPSIARRLLALVAATLVSLGTPGIGQAAGADKITVAGWSQPITEITNLLAEPDKGFFKAKGIALDYVPGNGGGAALQNMLAGQADIAFTDPAALYLALDKGEKLVAIYNIYPQNVFNVVALKSSGIRTAADLKGKRIGVGAPNSGVEINARMIFEAHGMTYKDVKIDYLNYGEAIDQMKNGLIDAAFVTSGLGNATIRELGVTKKIAFVPVDGEARQRLIKKYPFYIESTIPAATYGTASDTPTAAVMNILVADKKLPADVVYDLLKNIFSPTGLETIQGSHATAKAHIKPENALRGIAGTAVPLHEGAIRYYKEVGLMK